MVAAAPQVQTQIDEFLDYLLRIWGGIPALAAEWGEWDEDSKLTFVHNWGVPTDRLHQVQEWAAQGLLTLAQQARYAELRRLVVRHGPTLDRLLAE